MKLIACIYVIIQINWTTAASIAEGKEFLISTPSMKVPFNEVTGYPRLVLTLMSSFTVTVKVVTKGLANTKNNLEKNLGLKPFKFVKFYNKSLFFGPDQKSGIRWTYHLTCDSPFVVMVSMETDMYVAETFVAVPVAGWGSHYIVTTLDKQFSVVLIAGEFENMLTFTFKAQAEQFTLSVNGVDQSQGSEFNLKLKKYQAYSIDNCAENGVGALTGSRVYGLQPFGVVNGNCKGYTQIKTCGGSADSPLMDGISGSTVAEMLLPEETLGYHYIMFQMTGRSSPGYVIIVATTAHTRVVVLDETNNANFVNLVQEGDWHTQKAEFATIKSFPPVYVTYVQNSSCQGSGDGDPSILMLIPMELFYFMYKCIVPDTEMKHFITLIINVNFQDSIQAMYFKDENPIIGAATTVSEDLKFDDSIGHYHVLELEVKRGASFTLYCLKSRFGSYVHGVSENSTYMHPSGFISSNIHKSYCINSEKTMKKGDFLDNDCDGMIDEEIDNGLDDDDFSRRDRTRVDEDLGFYYEETATINDIFTSAPDNMQLTKLITYRKDYVPRTTTQSSMATTEIAGEKTPLEAQSDYSDWSPWECQPDCSIRKQQRTRMCLRISSKEKCQGADKQIGGRGDCYMQSGSCPVNKCPEKTYGFFCAKKCPHCQGDCNKFDGSCSECLNGFEYPQTGCQIDVDRYLPWTEWACTSECGKPYMVRERKARESVDRCKGQEEANCFKTFIEQSEGDCNDGDVCAKAGALGVLEGKEFLISTPSMKFPLDKATGYPRLVLTMMSSHAVKVKIVSEGLVDTIDYIEKDLNLQPFQPTRFYDKTLFFGPDLQSGVRWTYHLTGDKPFAVMVSMETDMHIAETFTAIPMSSWGSQYIVTTLDKHSSVVIINGETENVLTFTFKTQPKHFTILVNGNERKQGSEFKLEISRYRSFSIDNCGKNGLGALTGSTVYGIQPFGVVAGNCNGYTEIQKCFSSPDSPLMDGLTGSTVAEMLLPLESLGKHFIVFSASWRSSPGYVIVVASQNKTVVAFRNYYQDSTIRLRTKGDWHTQRAEFAMIEAYPSVYVTFVQNSSCFWTSEGDPSIMMLIPLELFYFIYKCMIPDTTMRNFITLVIIAEHRESVQVMYFEGEDPILGLSATNSKDLYMFGSFYILEYEVKRRSSFTLYSLKSRFGCYVHGVGPYATYMHTAGFMTSNINPEFCKTSENIMKIGDFVDNDCDGKVDEEKDNGKDDDKSAHKENNPIDEDLGFFFEDGDTLNAIFTSIPENARHQSLSSFGTDYVPQPNVFSTRGIGTSTTKYTVDHSEVDFSEWTEWECFNDCSITDQLRTRYCLRLSSQEGCQGPTNQSREGDCYTKSCPNDCPYETFGIDCQQQCLFCKGDCDKFNGSCSECLDGLEYPETGCHIDTSRYNQWTEWSCTVECGKSFMFRERKPQNEVDLCIGRTTDCFMTFREIRPGDCNVGNDCRKPCEDFTFGTECKDSCVNCEQPCDKSTGECKNCRGGFMDGTTSCTTPCGVNQWGPGCVFNCTSRCGEGHDCFDRVHGDCFPKSNSSIVLYITLAMIIVVVGAVPIFVFVAMRSSNNKTKQGPATSETSAMSMKDDKKARSNSKPKLSILSVLSRSPSQKSIKSVAKEAEAKPADVLSRAGSENTV